MLSITMCPELLSADKGKITCFVLNYRHPMGCTEIVCSHSGEHVQYITGGHHRLLKGIWQISRGSRTFTHKGTGTTVADFDPEKLESQNPVLCYGVAGWCWCL